MNAMCDYLIWAWNAIAWGTLADWVSGLGALAAALVALRGYRLTAVLQREDRVEREAAEAARIEGEKLAAVRQIAIKLLKMLADSEVTVDTLSSRNTPAKEWLKCDKPLEILGGQPPVIHAEAARSYALTAPEENLLLALKEEEFLMEYMEAVRRAEVVDAALREYPSRYQVVFSMLEGHFSQDGDETWLEILQEADPVVLPYAIQAASVIQHARQQSLENLERLTPLASSFNQRMSARLPGLGRIDIQDSQVLECLIHRAPCCTRS